MREKQERLEFKIAEKKLKYSKYELSFLRIYIGICFILLCIFLAGLYTDFFTIFSEIIIFTGLMALCYLYFVQKDNHFLKDAGVTCDEDGLWYSNIDKSTGLVKWSDVYSIKKSIIWKKNRLFDQNGNELLIVDNRLEDVGELKLMLAYFGTSLYLASLPFETHRKNSERIQDGFMSIAFISFCVMFFLKKEYLPFSFFLLMLIFVIYSGIKNQIQSIKITQESLCISYLFHKKTINKDSIVGVGFFDSIDHGQPVSLVAIETLSDESLQTIDGMRADQFVLYRVLVKAFPKSQ